MKKYLYLLMMGLLSAMSICLTACGGDDDEPDSNNNGSKSKIVGIWEITQTTTKYYSKIPEMQDYYDREEVEYGDGSYWEFSSSKLTVHDMADLADSKPVKYTYNESAKELKIAGTMTYTVKKLTNSEMILVMDTSDANFGVKTTIEFQKQ